MFILTISCLITFNFLWFMDLIFHVTMQYCSLQHWILLSSPGTWTTECHICFCPAASFILGLFVILLYSSPIAYWTLSDLGDSPFGVISFWPFSTVHEVPMPSTLWRFDIPYCSESCCVISLCYDLSWVALHGMAQSFIKLCKPIHHDKAVIHEGDQMLADSICGCLITSSWFYSILLSACFYANSILFKLQLMCSTV